MTRRKKLTTEEWDVLANLLSRMTFPMPPNVFDAWCGASVTVPIELVVLERDVPLGNHRVLLFKRRDKYFKGHALPGSVLLPGETPEKKLQRLIAREVTPAGLSVTEPMFVDWVRTMKGGASSRRNPRGQEIALLYICQVLDAKGGKVEAPFFLFDRLPDDILGHHRRLVARARKAIRDLPLTGKDKY